MRRIFSPYRRLPPMQTPATQQDNAVLQESTPDSQLYEQLPPDSLAAYVEEDRPFSYVIEQNGGEVVKRVLAALLRYPPTPGTRPAPTTVICVDPGKFSNKVGGIQQRLIVEREIEYEEEVEPRFVHVNEPVALKLAERATFSEGPSAQTWRLLSTSS